MAEGAGNEGGKVGPGLGDDNRTSDAGKGEVEGEDAVRMVWVGGETEGGLGDGWAGAEMMEGLEFVEDGKTGRGAEEATREGASGT